MRKPIRDDTQINFLEAYSHIASAMLGRQMDMLDRNYAI